MKSLCVFCGSSPGARPEYLEVARLTGRTLAEDGIRLVYGGGSVGMMGATADACLAAGGEVTGVITKRLVGLEVGHEGLTNLEVVDSMHERKARMAELSDGFIALPGGAGTLEELFEVFTWSQLEIHAKPMGLVNVAGYFDRLQGFLDHMVAERFLLREHGDMLLTAEDPSQLISKMRAYKPVELEKWVERKTTGAG